MPQILSALFLDRIGLNSGFLPYFYTVFFFQMSNMFEPPVVSYLVIVYDNFWYRI